MFLQSKSVEGYRIFILDGLDDKRRQKEEIAQNELDRVATSLVLSLDESR